MVYQITKNGKRLSREALIFAPSIEEALQMLSADARAQGFGVVRVPLYSYSTEGTYYNRRDRRRKPLPASVDEQED